MLFRTFCCAAIALALAGCNATMPQASRPTAADDPSRPCFESVAAQPELATIARHIPLGNASAVTIEQMASKETPTDVEKAELSKWAKLRMDCAARGQSFRAQYAPPGWVATFEQLQSSVLQSIAALYGGGTYGQFNVERQRIGTQARSGFEAADQNAQRSEQAEQQARQNGALQALQMQQLLRASMPQPQPLPMPAAPIYCNSQRIGSQVSTTCR